MVAGAGPVLGDEASDRLGAEDPLPFEPAAAEQIVHKGDSGPRSQRATGMPNPFLGRRGSTPAAGGPPRA